MAHTQVFAGDNYDRGWNKFTKIAAAAYTAPLVGDLVSISATVANAVDGPADEGLPYGIVEHVEADNTTLTIAELNAGGTIELPYSGSLVVGDAIEMAGATQGTLLKRTIVSVENSGGVGAVIAVDADAPHGTGYAVVRFK